MARRMHEGSYSHKKQDKYPILLNIKLNDTLKTNNSFLSSSLPSILPLTVEVFFLGWPATSCQPLEVYRGHGDNDIYHFQEKPESEVRSLTPL